MLSLTEPQEAVLHKLLEEQKALAPTYSEVGATRAGTVPGTYGVDKVRGKIGTGGECFAASVERFKQWQEFGMSWIKLYPSVPTLEAGQTLLVQAFVVGIWSLNACRIIYVIDEPNRFGFGYGTLPEHAEIGEERFLIEWNRETDEVTYAIQVFSNPSRWYYWLAFPLHKHAQDKFRRESLALMKSLSKSVVLAIAMASFLCGITFAQPLQHEQPKFQAAHNVIRGGVNETQLQDGLERYGVTMSQDMPPGTFPALVGKVERGSAAFDAGIQEHDIVLNIERGASSVFVTLQRNGARSRVEIARTSLKTTVGRDSLPTVGVQQKQASRAVTSQTPKLVINAYAFGGGGVDNMHVDVDCVDGKIVAQMAPNGPDAHQGGGRCESCQIVMFADGHCTVTSCLAHPYGRLPAPQTLAPPVRSGTLPEDVAKLMVALNDSFPAGADFIEVNDAEMVCGGASNYQAQYRLSGSQPDGQHYKSALVLNNFHFLSGGIGGCFFGGDTSACLAPIAGANRTDVFTCTDYNLGFAGGNSSYNFNGRQGTIAPPLKTKESDIPPQMQSFLNEATYAARLFRTKYNN